MSVPSVELLTTLFAPVWDGSNPSLPDATPLYTQDLSYTSYAGPRYLDRLSSQCHFTTAYSMQLHVLNPLYKYVQEIHIMGITITT